jgi:hypothetical protein
MASANICTSVDDPTIANGTLRLAAKSYSINVPLDEAALVQLPQNE